MAEQVSSTSMQESKLQKMKSFAGSFRDNWPCTEGITLRKQSTRKPVILEPENFKIKPHLHHILTVWPRPGNSTSLSICAWNSKIISSGDFYDDNHNRHFHTRGFWHIVGLLLLLLLLLGVNLMKSAALPPMWVFMRALFHGNLWTLVSHAHSIIFCFHKKHSTLVEKVK